MLSSAYNNLFLRNWVNNTATEADIDKAVTKGYITEEQAETIKNMDKV
ncbi:MAG TPA: hypothetical protein VGN87_10520 [Paenibacillus sp.]|jgi:hypothetical protein